MLRMEATKIGQGYVGRDRSGSGEAMLVSIFWFIEHVFIRVCSSLCLELKFKKFRSCINLLQISTLLPYLYSR
jgi:hypothetical protein